MECVSTYLVLSQVTFKSHRLIEGPRGPEFVFNQNPEMWRLWKPKRSPFDVTSPSLTPPQLPLYEYTTIIRLNSSDIGGWTINLQDPKMRTYTSLA